MVVLERKEANLVAEGGCCQVLAGRILLQDDVTCVVVVVVVVVLCCHPRCSKCWKRKTT